MVGRNNNTETEIELNTKTGNPPRSRVSHEEDDNLFRTPRQSISSDKNDFIFSQDKNIDTKNEIKDPIEKEDLNNKNEIPKEEEDVENVTENWSDMSNSRRSNCGRNIS